MYCFAELHHLSGTLGEFDTAAISAPRTVPKAFLFSEQLQD
jgi:hypothetical protein